MKVSVMKKDAFLIKDTIVLFIFSLHTSLKCHNSKVLERILIPGYPFLLSKKLSFFRRLLRMNPHSNQIGITTPIGFIMH